MWRKWRWSILIQWVYPADEPNWAKNTIVIGANVIQEHAKCISKFKIGQSIAWQLNLADTQV
jgi:hypothetical protein